MRATRVMRFVLCGAVGFGIGGAIVGASGDAMLLGFFAMGALGGASLGLAASNIRSIATLALTGTLGFGIGFLAAFAIVLLIWDPFGNWFIGAVGGLLGGASLGVASRTWRRIVLLSVVGGLGFGLGWGAVDVLRQPLVVPGASGIAFWWAILFMTIEGVIGGASLGATLGYLEKRKLAEERGPRVR
jgi:hypothetical protein